MFQDQINDIFEASKGGKIDGDKLDLDALAPEVSLTDVCMDLMQHFPLDTDGAVRLTALKSLENISIFGSRLPVAVELLNVTVVSHAPPANLSRMVTRESDYLHFDCNFATYHLGKHEYKNPFVRDMAIDNACRFSSILDVYRANIK